MKITYPECQIEIDVDEFIELNDYYEGLKAMKSWRSPELHELNPVDFDKSRLNVKDKEWLEETLKDGRDKLLKDLLDSTDPNRHGDGDGIVHLIHKEPAPESQDPELEPEEDPTPTFEPGGIIGEGESEPEGEKVIRMSKEMKKAIVENTPYVGRKKPSGKTKKVDILFESGWKTFDSITKGAKAIDARLNHLSYALLNGKTCNGHHVRYHEAIDDCLAEIEARNKKSYEPSKPIK